MFLYYLLCVYYLVIASYFVFVWYGVNVGGAHKVQGPALCFLLINKAVLSSQLAWLQVFLAL